MAGESTIMSGTQICLIQATRGSGWDHWTQTIVLVHRDRWNSGVVWGGLGDPPLAKRE